MKLADNPLFRQPGWVAAHARLLALLPAARERIPAPYDMIPDEICSAAKAAGVPYEWVLLRNPWRANPKGSGNRSFEEYANLDLFDVVFAAHPPTPGPMWFIPDDCFIYQREPYLVAGEALREFLADCPCSLTHDVLFIWAEAPRVSLIHHEGGFTHLFLSGVEA
jgi:hypothetical protein